MVGLLFSCFWRFHFNFPSTTHTSCHRLVSPFLTAFMGFILLYSLQHTLIIFVHFISRIFLYISTKRMQHVALVGQYSLFFKISKLFIILLFEEIFWFYCSFWLWIWKTSVSKSFFNIKFSVFFSINVTKYRILLKLIHEDAVV